jgi:hypothetical protein
MGDIPGTAAENDEATVPPARNTNDGGTFLTVNESRIDNVVLSLSLIVLQAVVTNRFKLCLFP